MRGRANSLALQRPREAKGAVVGASKAGWGLSGRGYRLPGR